MRIGLMSSIVIAAVIHVFVANAFVFTFPNGGVSTKPVFVFLGSFLRSEDVMLALGENSNPNNDRSARLKLDIREGSLPREFDKPDLTTKVVQPVKYQFKPVMKEEQKATKPKENPDDLGMDLAPFVPVRMNINQNDQN